MKSKLLALGMMGFGVVVTHATNANAACGSGLACEVCDNGFTPTQMAAPLGPMTGDCTDQDISDFDSACLATSASSTSCSTWQSANPTCAGCLVTQDTASTWGFVVCNSAGCSLNAAGCVDVASGTVSQEKQAGGPGTCGDALNTSYECQDYACSTCSTSDFNTCDQSALTNECATYSAPVTSTTGPCAALNNDAGTAAVCFTQDETSQLAMATFMCGGAVTPPPDGGTTTDGGTTSDGGTKTDAGAKDAGKTGDAGGDAGSAFGGKGGCHCDAAGGGGDSLALVAISAGLAAAFARRKRRA